MKKTIMQTVLLFASLVFGQPAGMRTANAAADAAADVAALQKRADEQDEEIANLKKLLAAKPAPETPEDSSMLATLAKGAGVDLADVRWRVAAGLDPEQAVEAAVSQKKAGAEAKAKKAAEKK